MLNGKDLLDSPVHVDSKVGDSRIILTFLDKHTSVSGSVIPPNGGPSPIFVAIFPSDQDLWLFPSRRVRTIQVSSSGSYAFNDLPAGEYMIGLLPEGQPPKLSDATSLDQLRSRFQRIVISDGDSRTLDLKMLGAR
jgi:hypothetical protein